MLTLLCPFFFAHPAVPFLFFAYPSVPVFLLRTFSAMSLFFRLPCCALTSTRIFTFHLPCCAVILFYFIFFFASPNLFFSLTLLCHFFFAYPAVPAVRFIFLYTYPAVRLFFSLLLS